NVHRSVLSLFFFQAEDGIRDRTVTGVQTCALPIWVLTEAELEVNGGAQARVSPFADGFDGAGLLQRAGFALPVSDVDRVTVRYRSEERRVGEEGRAARRAGL